MLEGATRRGKDMLVDNQGYSYTVKVGMRRIYRNPLIINIVSCLVWYDNAIVNGTILNITHFVTKYDNVN